MPGSLCVTDGTFRPIGGASAALAAFVLLVVAGVAPAVHAQTPTQKAAAAARFEEARKLYKAGKLEQACPKFVESYELEPTIGTMLNIARCYEDQGKLASAWVSYNQVAAEAKQAGQRDRAAYANKKANELKPKVGTLTIEVTTPLDDMKIERGEEVVPEAAWGIAVPIDAGEHTIVVTAPGKQPWSHTVTLGARAEALVVTVPALEDVPVEPVPAAEPADGDAGIDGADATEGGSILPVLGWVAIGVGLAGVGAGVGLRVVALNKDDESLAHCDPNDVTFCNAEGVALREEATGLQLGSLIAFVAGGVIAATGVVLVVADAAADDDPSDVGAALQVVPIVSPSSLGLSVGARF